MLELSFSVCLHRCMYVCMYAYMYIHMCVCIHMHIKYVQCAMANTQIACIRMLLWHSLCFILTLSWPPACCVSLPLLKPLLTPQPNLQHSQHDPYHQNSTPCPYLCGQHMLWCVSLFSIWEFYSV